MGDTVLTYVQFVDAAGRVAAGLEARGVMPGDRVDMVLPNVLVDGMPHEPRRGGRAGERLGCLGVKGSLSHPRRPRGPARRDGLT
jgi:acyl-CoA synthetase (AMP-forming)/AMP-acid ligase II